MHFRWKALSHVGLVRANNEDAVLVHRNIFRNEAKHGALRIKGNALLFVADGMGGHSFGEEASWRTLRFVQEKLSKCALLNASAREMIVNVILQAHHNLLREGGNFGNLGTTLCGIVGAGKRIYLVNVGDSRCYRFRNGRLCLLSRDHSLREESGDPSIPGNFLTSVVGGGSYNIKIDVTCISRKIRHEDVFVFCTDGLSEYVSDCEIEQALKEYIREPHVGLLAAALRNGAPDNVSVIVAKVRDS